jgi:Fe(3+) dicitrate transport protein
VFVALPVDGLGVLAGLNQGFSPVPPGQGTLPVPEKSLNAEYGARYAPSRALRVEAIGFHNAYSNLANVCTFSTGCTSDGTDRQFNAGRARVLGLELEAEVERTLADDLALSGRAAYTLTDARFSDDFESADPIFGAVRAGDRLPYVPVHQASASVGVDWAWSSVGIGGTYVGAMREVAGQGTPGPGEATDAYFLLDGSLKARPVDHVELYLTGKNLLDSVYLVSRRPFGARPGAPLWLQAGVKVDY